MQQTAEAAGKRNRQVSVWTCGRYHRITETQAECVIRWRAWTRPSHQLFATRQVSKRGQASHSIHICSDKECDPICPPVQRMPVSYVCSAARLNKVPYLAELRLSPAGRAQHGVSDASQQLQCDRSPSTVDVIALSFAHVSQE